MPFFVGIILRSPNIRKFDVDLSDVSFIGDCLIPLMRFSLSMTSDTSGNNRRGLFSIFLMSLLVFLVIPWQVAFLSCYLIVFHICATEKEPIGDRDYYEQKRHILLLMTWCLPVVAPVLAVWIRTVATAGFTTPFDGDHNVLNVIGFMILTYALSQSRGRPVFVKPTRYVISKLRVMILMSLRIAATNMFKYPCSIPSGQSFCSYSGLVQPTGFMNA